MKKNTIMSFEEAAPLRVEPLIRRTNYYETDQMGVIHHSHYVRWMEEARVDVMEQLGFGYDKMEAMGVFSPVLGLSVDYKSPVRFGEHVSIECRFAEYSGLKLTLLYKMTNLDTGAVCTYCESRHGFLDREGHILSLKRSFPDIHLLLQNAMTPEIP